MLMEQHNKEMNDIADILFAMEQNFQERENDAKADFQSMRDEIKNKVGMIFLFFYFFIFYTSLSLSGNLGRLNTRVRLQQPQEQHCPVLQVHAGSFRVSVIH